MTDKEIKKALECCSNVITSSCKECSYHSTYNANCVRELMRNALDLINRQQAEIERLKEELLDSNMEIAELYKCKFSADDVAYNIIRARAEAIKEFAERLKENKIDIDVSFGYGKGVYTEAVAVIEIDNLVKEMVGEDNG